jgi:hypothetical protein
LLAPPLPAPVLRYPLVVSQGDMLQVPVEPYVTKELRATSEIKALAQESFQGISGI